MKVRYLILETGIRSLSPLAGFAVMAAMLLSPSGSQQTATALPHLNPDYSMPFNQTIPLPPGPSNPDAYAEVVTLPATVAQRVKQEVAEQNGIPAQDLAITQFSRETWNDGCLGLPAPDEFCTMALVEGWQVEVSRGQQHWIYRTDATGSSIRPEPLTDTPDLPDEVSALLLQTIAQQESMTKVSHHH